MHIKEHDDKFWMQHAIALAERAKDEGEIPVGAVLVLNGEAVCEGWNCSIGYHDPTGHAEIMALRKGGSLLKNYRLLNTALYVTLEPCIMCAGAMIHARIHRAIFGARNIKTGAAGSFFNVLECSRANHRISVTFDVMSNACADQLNKFFRNRRRYNKKQNIL